MTMTAFNKRLGTINEEVFDYKKKHTQFRAHVFTLFY
jgi:hypothetical protein